MNDRAKAAARVAQVRTQMADLAEWRHRKAEQAAQAVGEARAEMDRFAAEAQPTGALARALTGQTARLSRRQAQAEDARDRALGATHQAQRQLKVAENVAARLDREAREHAERRDLERLLEQFAGGSSLP